ncbi:MAG TPA: T9SS type A sorting domain-containing protein [Puia sp.]|nr:T9SS type A sorting domain-containing protein [Puia sp.]
MRKPIVITFILLSATLTRAFGETNVPAADSTHKDAQVTSVYPGPANGTSLSDKNDLKSSDLYTIEITDNRGKLISRRTVNQPEFSVDLPKTLPSGVYFVKFSSADFSTTTRFLVKH